jgi:hypothetical protein
MQSDDTTKNIGYITTAPHYLSDASSNPLKKIRKIRKEIYADIIVPIKLLETLSSKFVTNEIEMRLKKSKLKIE